MKIPRREKRAQGFSPVKEDWKSFLCRLLIIFILPGTLGAGTMEKGSEEMEVTGKIYLMGNEPFTQVAVETKDGQIYVLLGEQTKELRPLQGRQVSVVGKLSEEKPRGAKAIDIRSFKVLKEK